MHRSYTIRLKATCRQQAVLSSLLVELCELYNAALQERRDAWKIERKQITRFDQHKELTQLRALDETSASFPLFAQRDPLNRVDLAFKAFFRRVKSRQKPGYPRFRSVSRYDSFSVDSQNFRIDGDTVIITKLGGFRLKTHCRLRGTPKALLIKRSGNKWQGQVVCDIGPAPEKAAVASAIGIDIGLTTLVTLSDGSEIDNPRWTAHESDRLAEANRSLARKVRGSKNRIKARERLRRVHQRIQSLRRSYLHDVSTWLLSQYDLVAHEKLNIVGMAQGRLAKSIIDAAWGELIWQLTYKAEEAGKYVVAVNPYGTTQICSGCGENVPKGLSQRWHSCPKCGLSLGRDHNAAINVLQRGMRCVEQSARG
jgi:putative transposase